MRVSKVVREYIEKEVGVKAEIKSRLSMKPFPLMRQSVKSCRRKLSRR